MVFDADFIPSPPLTGPLLTGVFASVAGPLCEAADASPEGVTVSLLYQGELADSSQIFIVRDADEQPLGIVQLSSEASPGMVARGVARARIAEAALGPSLGRTVLLPLSEGEIEGRSYAVMPYCLPFSGQRWRWALERLWVAPAVLDWLHGIAATTLSAAPAVDIALRFQRPLEQLRSLVGASDRLVAGCGWRSRAWRAAPGCRATC